MPWVLTFEERLFWKENGGIKDQKERQGITLKGVPETREAEPQAREEAMRLWRELKKKENHEPGGFAASFGFCGKMGCEFTQPRLALALVNVELETKADIPLDA